MTNLTYRGVRHTHTDTKFDKKALLEKNFCYRGSKNCVVQKQTVAHDGLVYRGVHIH